VTLSAAVTPKNPVGRRLQSSPSVASVLDLFLLGNGYGCVCAARFAAAADVAAATRVRESGVTAAAVIK
jgi:hypothetical protein